MKRIYLLLSLLTGCLYMQAAIYNVRDFGAKADGYKNEINSILGE